MATFYQNFKEYTQRLLATEKSQVTVKAEALLRVALVFPNAYEVGMANLGFQEVYRLFNIHPAVSCERCFLYATPFEKVAQTLETGRPLREFDLIAFSVSFELDYPNVAQILQNSRLALRATTRNHRDPLILVGGTVTLINPTPLAPLIDVFILGEATDILADFIGMLAAHKSTGLKSARSLETLAAHPSCWVPNITAASGRLQPNLRKSWITPIQSSILTPASHFKNMHLIEVGRACGRGCHFCAAGFVYRPACYFPWETILAQAQTNPFQTKRIGLIGAALSDYPRLHTLCQALVDDQFELGLSSFRVDAITPDFVKILVAGGIKNLTLAPEAGSLRLRNVIHKQLTAAEIFSAIEALANSTITTLKFYFMIGLPTETDADLEAIVQLMRQAARRLKSNFKINVSVNAFIPKPGTPFQWSALATEKELTRRRNYLIQELHALKRLQLRPKSARIEVLQALFSQGDSRVGEILIEQAEKHLTWTEILKAYRPLVNEFVFREKLQPEPLPWDFLMSTEKKLKLYLTWQKIKSVTASEFGSPSAETGIGY